MRGRYCTSVEIGQITADSGCVGRYPARQHDLDGQRQDRVHRLSFGAQVECGARLASAIGRAGHSVEVGREVVRFNPLGINEGATPEAQLWVLMAQVQQELELRNRAEVLVTDRSVVDNFAYYLRVTDGADPFRVEPLIRRWAQTYDLFVRLLPDVALLPDGVRSTNDGFRDEIEAILDRILPQYVAGDCLINVPASQVTEAFDWLAIAERLATLRGESLAVSSDA
jgi:nicotinamide riboside kinase